MRQHNLNRKFVRGSFSGEAEVCPVGGVNQTDLGTEIFLIRPLTLSPLGIYEGTLA